MYNRRNYGLSSVAERKFMQELRMLLQRNVVIVTNNGKTYTGTLSGYNPRNMSVCLSDVKNEEGNLLNKLFINGSMVAQMYTVEKPFDLGALSERLDKVFPRMVKLYEEAGIIVVMDKIRVNEKGIIEGSGPAAERVQRVYDEFMREKSQT